MKKRVKRSRGEKGNAVRDATLLIMTSGVEMGDSVSVQSWNRVSRTVWHVLAAFGYCMKQKRRVYRWLGIEGARNKWNQHEMLSATVKDQTENVTHACLYVMQVHCNAFLQEDKWWSFAALERKVRVMRSDICARRIYDIINILAYAGLLERPKSGIYRWIAKGIF